MRIRTTRRNAVRGAVVALAVAVAGIGATMPASAKTSQSTGTATYTVKDGDTLSAIAARFGVSAAAIASANSLTSPDRLSIGTRLTIPKAPARTSQSKAAAVKADAKAKSKADGKTKSTAQTKATVKPGRYVVNDGDTVIGLARRAGTSPRAIIAANGLAPPAYMIRSGATITIPSASGGAKSAKSAKQRSGGSEASATSATRGGPVAGSGYRVRRGDTVLGVAARSGVSAAAIIAANRLRPPTYMIRDGQNLQIPNKGQTPTKSVARSGTGAVPPGTGRHPNKAQVGAALEANARRYGLPADLVKGLAWQESGWRQEVVSSVGAVGVMQLMPETARWISDKLVGRRIDSNNYTDNVQGGTAYLDYLLGQVGQDERLALASYYQGLSAVKRKGLYEESKRYVASVQANRKKFR